MIRTKEEQDLISQLRTTSLNNPETWRKLAAICEQEGRLDDTEVCLLASLYCAPTDFDVMRRWFNVYLKNRPQVESSDVEMVVEDERVKTARKKIIPAIVRVWENDDRRRDELERLLVVITKNRLFE